MQVYLGADRYVIEMAPVWGNSQPDRGAVGQGAVGLPWLSHSRFFRYDIRRWPGGIIPDLAEAVASAQFLTTDTCHARRILELVPAFPTVTWGRDELGIGEMWNSNSLIAWLIARSGHHLDTVRLPRNGRAPGWLAGLVVAARDTAPSSPTRAGPSTVKPRSRRPPDRQP